MNKKTIIIVTVIVGLILAGGGVFAYSSNQNNKKQQEKMAMEKKSSDEAMIKKNNEDSIEKEEMAEEADSTKKESEAMKKEDTTSKQGSYITLADYNKDSSKYADSKKVYFFHASWCHICQEIDKAISADASKVPSGVTIIKTNFDNSTELRKKYGVTTQHTFVQVDNDGNETAQWSGASLSDAINGIRF